MKKTLMIAAMVAACMMAAMPASAEPSATHPTVQAYTATSAQPAVAERTAAEFRVTVTRADASMIALAESPQRMDAASSLDSSMTATSTTAGPEVLAKKGKGGSKKKSA